LWKIALGGDRTRGGGKVRSGEERDLGSRRVGDRTVRLGRNRIEGMTMRRGRNRTFGAVTERREGEDK
jgi:hypothetical protein